jgi:hypothetical protein
VGERETGAPGPAPQYFWLWAPIQFEDCCTHFDVNEDETGGRWHAFGSVLPALPPDAAADAPLPEPPTVVARVEYALSWLPGTRRARDARLTLVPARGASLEISLEPLLTFQMLGIGYLHPEWGHGLWKGELAVAAERWRLDACAPLDPRYLHVQALCRARMGTRVGVGILEQLVIGPHAPSGFAGILDGAR